MDSAIQPATSSHSLTRSSTYANDGTWSRIVEACEEDPYTTPGQELVRIVERDEDAASACEQVEIFLPFLAKFLSQDLVAEVRSVLRDLEITGLPRITLDDATEHVVYIYCSEQSGSVIDRGGGAGDGGLGGAEGSGGGGGDPSGRNGNDKGGGGGGGRGHDFTTRVRFAQCSVLPVRTQYTSPDGSIRKKIIAHSARRFEEAWTVPFRPFDISNPTMAGELQLLYHATRRSQLDCFLPAGIQLQFHTRQHELAVRGAFYACNNLATAVAHALTYKHSPASRVDPVVVFVFAVDPEVIQGSKPSFDGASLKLRVLDVPASETDVGYREQYRQFCTFVRGNWTKSEAALAAEMESGFDFIVGPISQIRFVFDERYGTDPGVDTVAERRWYAAKPHR